MARRRFSRSGITRKFQWFIDFNTDNTQMTQIKVTAGGSDVVKRLLPFFTAFKYYKLGSVKVKLFPASTLPVDPTGLSYGGTEDQVDPRDMFDAGLIRITNGEDFDDRFLTVGNQIPQDTGTPYTVTEQDVRGTYYQMMLDPRWFKFNMQNGVNRFATPRFWQIGQFAQDSYPGSIVNAPVVIKSPDNGDFELMTPQSGAREMKFKSTSVTEEGITYSNTSWAEQSLNGSDNRGFFQTGMKGRLGWLPTDTIIRRTNNDDRSIEEIWAGLTNVPEIELMRIFLPMAYKTKFYFRMIVEETVHFRSPVDTLGIWATEGRTNESLAFFMPDRFVLPRAQNLGSNPINQWPVDPDNVQNDGEGTEIIS